MRNHKLWEGDNLEETEAQEEPKPEPKEAKFEVVRAFSFGKQKVLPGGELPSGISEAALVSLLRKRVLRAL